MRYLWGEPRSPWIHGEDGCWKTLFDGASLITISKNENLINQGDNVDCVWCVQTGRLRATTLHWNGNEKQAYIAEHLAMIGDTDCLQSLPSEVTVTGIVESTLRALPKHEFFERINSDVELTRLVLDYQARKTAMFHYQTLMLTHSSARSRILQTLLDLEDVYGKEVDAGCLIDVRFTKNEIADLVGTSRVTASNIMMELKRKGYITEQNGRYVIVDEAKILDLLDEN